MIKKLLFLISIFFLPFLSSQHLMGMEKNDFVEYEAGQAPLERLDKNTFMMILERVDTKKEILSLRQASKTVKLKIDSHSDEINRNEKIPLRSKNNHLPFFDENKPLNLHIQHELKAFKQWNKDEKARINKEKREATFNACHDNISGCYEKLVDCTCGTCETITSCCSKKCALYCVIGTIGVGAIAGIIIGIVFKAMNYY
jgi:hypothetical protein